MLLTKHKTVDGPRWALGGMALPPSVNLTTLLEMRREAMLEFLNKSATGESLHNDMQAPIDSMQEVWAAGVTYLRSKDARKAESTVADIYEKVYEAERPEVFSKSIGWRVSGSGERIRIRKNSQWNVPEPELVLVINRYSEIVGYCAGNDVSSRDIEGENPLYLPQAKIYNGSCALGHGIKLCAPDEIKNIPIQLSVERSRETIFSGEANTSIMKRGFAELIEFLTRELEFPQGVFLMTGTCLVPGNNFTLRSGDVVNIQVGEAALVNPVE